MAELSRDEQVNRTNRLLALRQSPGWIDLVRISEALVAKAKDTACRFGGWDMQQSFCLQQRAKAAIEYHEELFGMISDQISQGLNPEAKASEADDLREKVLREMSEGRDTGFTMGNTYPPPDLRTGDL